MMSVLEKVDRETRRKTGWLLPVAASVGLGTLPADSSATIGRSEQLWLGGLGLAGIVVGLLWQWYSPRDLSARLIVAAGGFVLVAILMLLPIGGEWNQHDRQLYLGLGIVAGLVIANWWKWLHTPDSDD